MCFAEKIPAKKLPLGMGCAAVMSSIAVNQQHILNQVMDESVQRLVGTQPCCGLGAGSVLANLVFMIIYLSTWSSE